jgi:probable addiction module antidote protein
MSKAKAKLLPFDAARYLTDDAAVAEYMTAVLEADDPDLLLLALGDVARARGMAQVAKDAGLGRESLYKALAPGAKPRFDTILKVARALGVRLTAHPRLAASHELTPNISLKRTRREASLVYARIPAARRLAQALRLSKNPPDTLARDD